MESGEGVLDLTFLASVYEAYESLCKMGLYRALFTFMTASVTSWISFFVFQHVGDGRGPIVESLQQASQPPGIKWPRLYRRWFIFRYLSSYALMTGALTAALLSLQQPNSISIPMAVFYATLGPYVLKDRFASFMERSEQRRVSASTRARVYGALPQKSDRLPSIEKDALAILNQIKSTRDKQSKDATSEKEEL